MEAWREGWRNGGSAAEGLAGCVKSSFGSLWQLVGVCWRGAPGSPREPQGGFRVGGPREPQGTSREPQGAPGREGEGQKVWRAVATCAGLCRPVPACAGLCRRIGFP